MVKKAQAIRILEGLRARIEPMIDDKDMLPGAALFLKWHGDVRAALRNIFPADPQRLERFDGLSFVPRVTSYTQRPTSDEVLRTLASPRNSFVQGLTHAQAMLSSLVDELHLYWGDDGTAENPTGVQVATQATPEVVEDPRKVFVVHGRNTALRDSMFNFLGSIGLRPVEWPQAREATGDPNPYVGDILDKSFSIAQAVVVLMTPDDEAWLKQEFHKPDDKDHETQLTGQARPNVLFEAGMAMGRYPKRTVLVEVGTLRPFSDIMGRHTVRLNDSTAQRRELANRLKTAGCEVDLSGDHWEKAGEFTLQEPVDVQTPASTAATEEDNPVVLDEVEVNILKSLAEVDGDVLSAEMLAQNLGLKISKIKHFADRLARKGYTYSMSGEDSVYGLAGVGRAYLVDHNLV